MKNTDPCSYSQASVLVMGNGPSARLIDFETLCYHGMASVGMNAAYRYWEKIDFRPTHYMCMDTVVIRSHAKQIAGLINEGRIKRYFLRNEFLELYPEFADHERIVWFDELRNTKGSLFDTHFVTTGSWAIRWMAYEGKRQIALIGIDVNYVEFLPEAQRLGAGSDLRLQLMSTPRFNPNYFFTDYQQAGDQYNIPNDPQYQQDKGGLVHVDALREAKQDIERAGVKTRIYDCSPLSSHGIFEKTELARLMVGGEIALATSFYCAAPIDELENNFRIAVANASNPSIASVTILLEGELESALLSIDSLLREEVRQKERQHRLRFIAIKARPSYLELFNLALAQSVELCAVANSDILLSEDFTSKFAHDYAETSRPFVALTRWNKTANGIFLQGQIAHPPWQEIPVEEITYLQTNYLSFDTYIFDRRCPLPPDLDQIRIGTFGCDTAVAALMRVAGQAVVNSCLAHVSLHVDEKMRDYKSAQGDEHMMINTEVVKKALLRRYDHLPSLQASLQALETLPPSLASIGVPMHSRGRWNSINRLLGLSPWSAQLTPAVVKIVKISVLANGVATNLPEIMSQFTAAMDSRWFIEIEVSGHNGDNYLECFRRHPELRPIHERLFRYDHQSCICLDVVSDEVRRIHADLLLIVRQHLGLANGSMAQSPGAAGMIGNSGRVMTRTSRLTKDTVGERDHERYPKLLIVDPTYVGHISATGQLKKLFLEDWPPDQVVQIWEDGGPDGKLMFLPRLGDTAAIEYGDYEQLLTACIKFEPDVIYLRPVDSPRLLEFALRLVADLAKPLVVHMMDDWLERLKVTDVARHGKLDTCLRKILLRASLRLSIGQAMSDIFQVRYGGVWHPLANGADLADFPSKDWGSRPRVSQESPFVIRYMGALADDMTYGSVREIAVAVSSLQAAYSVRFEIYTMEWCRSKAEQDVGKLPGVAVHPLVEEERYKQSLAEADALVIAYNFDPKSVSYIGLSLANKMPECLASGAPLIAYGPSDVATIEYLKKSGCALVVDKCDQGLLIAAIQSLVEDTSLCQRLSDRARAHVDERLSKSLVQQKFKDHLRACRQGALPMHVPEVGPFTRGQHAHYDETDCIAELFKGVLPGQLMIDVGAHHGWAHAPFLARGWRIFAFEPDDQNRAKLLELLAKHKNKHLVDIDTRCVSNKSQKGVSFFTSEQSTGISGLSAFHQTHVEAQKVDTTTLTEFFQDRPLSSVDFLKIDTEGHDLFVLQGFPWERCKPAVIECEFEDTKTVPLGYTFHDLATYLVDKGFQVYVSEWHPIIRYGIRHDWRALMRYPCELSDPKGWGNLLAFREPIDEQVLVAAVKKVLKVGVTEGAGGTAKASAKPVSSSVSAAIVSDKQAFRFEPSPYFTQTDPNLWRYTDAEEGQKLWMAVLDHPVSAGQERVGHLRIRADRAMTVNVSLGRHGSKDYEGTTQRIGLAPGVAQSVKLVKQFAKPHAVLKLQVEVLDLPGGGSANLTIEDLLITESPAAVKRQHGDAPFTLREANRLFRDGDLAVAMQMYLQLYEQRPLQIYADNALSAAHKLGLGKFGSVGALRQGMQGSGV